MPGRGMAFLLALRNGDCDRLRCALLINRKEAAVRQEEPCSGPLLAAWKIQSDASQLGFDWPDITGVFAKVREETEEISEAWNAGDREHAKRELGDLLFAAVNLARFLDADPNAELERANARFSERFEIVKRLAKERGIAMRECPLEALDVLWEEAKAMLRSAREKTS